MRTKLFALTLITLFFTALAGAQDFTIPDLPSTKEEFIKSEPDIIAAAKWLETTPIGTLTGKRPLVNAYVIAWITNSPTVTVEIQEVAVKICEDNPELLAVFMGGYTRYILEHNYSNDKLKTNTAAIKAVLNCYALGGNFKKNKVLTKAVEADQDGKLEEWVAEKLKTK